MAEFFEGRRLHYEVQVLAEGRWRIQHVINDERDARGRFDRLDFEETERNVIGQANSLLASGKFEAVRVLRERRRDDGFATSSEIYRKAATSERDTPLSIGRLEGKVERCTDVADLARRPACQMIGTLLRGFLDRMVLTPLELMHHAPYLRKLTDQHYGLVQAAVHHVASLQAGATAKERITSLERLIAAVERRARDAMAERKLPALENGDLERLAARIEARCGSADLDFYLHVAMARRLQGTQSYQAKLAIVFESLARPLPPALTTFVDAWTAGVFDSSQLVMDLLGRQPNLAAALIALTELASGRFTATGEAAAITAALAAPLSEGRMPAVVEAIWERLVRELRRGRPLCRNDDRREWSTLMQFSDRLPAAAPPAFKDPIRTALKRRVHRLQEADVA